MTGWLPPVQSLRAFVAAVRSGSFLAAGEAMGLSHGAVSHHVAQLEHLVGTKLFHRHRRGVVPTPAAEELARRISRSLDDLSEAIGDAGANSRRSLTVTLTPALAQRWLIPRLSDFQRLQPGIDLRIRPTAHVLDLDIEGIEVALRYGTGEWLGAVEPLHIADKSVFPVASPNYRGGKLPKRPEQLRAVSDSQSKTRLAAVASAAANVPNIEPSGPSVDDADLILPRAARELRWRAASCQSRYCRRTPRPAIRPHNPRPFCLLARCPGRVSSIAMMFRD